MCVCVYIYIYIYTYEDSNKGEQHLSPRVFGPRAEVRCEGTSALLSGADAAVVPVGMRFFCPTTCRKQNRAPTIQQARAQRRAQSVGHTMHRGAKTARTHMRMLST